MHTPSQRPQKGSRCPAVLVRVRLGGGHGDLRIWGSLGGCPVCVARDVDRQRALASCKTERSVLQGNAPRDQVLP